MTEHRTPPVDGVRPAHPASGRADGDPPFPGELPDSERARRWLAEDGITQTGPGTWYDAEPPARALTTQDLCNGLGSMAFTDERLDVAGRLRVALGLMDLLGWHPLVTDQIHTAHLGPQGPLPPDLLWGGYRRRLEAVPEHEAITCSLWFDWFEYVPTAAEAFAEVLGNDRARLLPALPNSCCAGPGGYWSTRVPCPGPPRSTPTGPQPAYPPSTTPSSAPSCAATTTPTGASTPPRGSPSSPPWNSRRAPSAWPRCAPHWRLGPAPGSRGGGRGRGGQGRRRRSVTIWKGRRVSGTRPSGVATPTAVPGRGRSSRSLSTAAATGKSALRVARARPPRDS